MLAKKFLHKHNFDNFDAKHAKKEQAISKLVTQNFDRFIDQNNFTQKNLERFEADLLQKIHKIMESEGLVIKTSHKAHKSNLALDQLGVKTPLNLISP